MSSTEIVLDIDWSRIEKDLEKKALDATSVLSAQIVADSEDYVPFMTSTLTKSAVLKSDFSTGTIVYDTPYARHLYYGLVYRDGKPTGGAFTYNQVHHHHAGAFWTEEAKKVYLQKWINKVKEVLEK